MQTKMSGNRVLCDSFLLTHRNDLEIEALQLCISLLS